MFALSCPQEDCDGDKIWYSQICGARLSLTCFRKSTESTMGPPARESNRLLLSPPFQIIILSNQQLFRHNEQKKNCNIPQDLRATASLIPVAMRARTASSRLRKDRSKDSGTVHLVRRKNHRSLSKFSARRTPDQHFGEATNVRERISALSQPSILAV